MHVMRAVLDGMSLDDCRKQAVFLLGLCEYLKFNP